MILKRLVLQNIRSYVNEDLEFPTGSLLLSGDIGAGKSTILQAVEFALFGSKRKQLSGDSLLRNGSKEGFVQLTVSIAGRELVIRRTLKLARASVVQGAGYIITNGVKTEGTAIELKSKILDVLGYPADYLGKSHDLIYRYTVYTPQEDMKAILFEDQDLRLETLRRVFSIDKYKRIRENVAVMARHYREQIKLVEGEISVLQNSEEKFRQIIQAISDTKKALEEQTQVYEKIRTRNADLEHQRDILDEKIKELSKINERISVQEALLKENTSHASRLAKQQAEAQEKRDALKESLKDFPKESVDPKFFESLQRDLDNLQDARIRLQGQISSLEEKRKQLSEQILQLDKDRRELNEYRGSLEKNRAEVEKAQEALNNADEVKAGLKQVNDELEQVSSAIAATKSRLESLNENSSKIKGQSKCPVCLQSVSEGMAEHIQKSHSILEEKLKRSLSKLEQDKNAYVNVKKKLEGEIEQFAVVQNRLSGLSERNANLKRYCMELEERINTKNDLSRQHLAVEKEFEEKILASRSFDEKIENLQKKSAEYSKIQKRLQEARDTEFRIKELDQAIKGFAEEREKCKSKVSEINRQLLTLRESVSSFEELQKRYDQIKNDYKKSLEELRAGSVSVAERRKSLESLQAQKESIDDDIAMLEKNRKKKSRIAKVKGWLENHFVKLTETMEKAAMQRLYSNFNIFFTQWFNMLIEEEALSARLNDEFSPVVIQNGYETSIQNLSGGEKTSLALAYRLALNKVINDYMGRIMTKDIIMLDEPTDGFSSDQLEKVRDVLDELNVKQAVIVSHEPKIESFVDHVIRIRKQEHKSEVVV